MTLGPTSPPARSKSYAASGSKVWTGWPSTSGNCNGRRNTTMVAQANATEVSTPNDTDIVMTRVFDAPAALVWEASTKPEHIERWWGPRSYTVEVKHMDVRVGGTYRIHHRNAEGQTFMFSGTYLELEPNSRMV